MLDSKEQRNQDASSELVVRECDSIAELDHCTRLQREAFGLPELEISPRRHLIVSQQAGGWTLGAFQQDELIGFVHHLVAIRGVEIIGYSHMMAIAARYQNKGVGARLKWAQRKRALAEGRSFIKWTWDPMQARNAHFNLNRLGVTVRSYAANFYGTNYNTPPGLDPARDGIDSDRLFAGWDLRSPRVTMFAEGRVPEMAADPAATVEIPSHWSQLIRDNRQAAQRELLRVRDDFQRAFAAGLVCAGFERDPSRPRYLLYRADDIERV